MKTPTRPSSQKKINLEVTDKAGKDNGDCAGDICDLYATVFEDTALPVGNYKVTISHQFEGEFLPNILGLGIEVSASLD